MKKQDIILIILGIILLISLVLSLFNYYKFSGGEWFCVANQCIEYSKGDDLVKNICSLQNGKMVCDFVLNDQRYKVDLDELDISTLENIKDVQIFESGCKEWKCSTQIYVKGGTE